MEAPAQRSMVSAEKKYVRTKTRTRMGVPVFSPCTWCAPALPVPAMPPSALGPGPGSMPVGFLLGLPLSAAPAAAAGGAAPRSVAPPCPALRVCTAMAGCRRRSALPLVSQRPSGFSDAAVGYADFAMSPNSA